MILYQAVVLLSSAYDKITKAENRKQYEYEYYDSLLTSPPSNKKQPQHSIEYRGVQQSGSMIVRIKNKVLEEQYQYYVHRTQYIVHSTTNFFVVCSCLCCGLRMMCLVYYLQYYELANSYYHSTSVATALLYK